MEIYDRAIGFYNKGHYGRSIEMFKEIIENDKDGKQLYSILSQSFCGRAYCHQGISFFTVGKFSKAAEDFRMALTFDPRNVEILEYLGLCHNNLGNFEKAAEAFDIILSIDPTHLSSKLKLANALHNLRIWDKAVSTYQDILKIYPSYADTHFRLGLSFLGLGKAEEAALAFQNAVEINPDYAEAKVKLGITHAYLGNFEEALSSLSSALKSLPHFADLHYFLGIVYASLPGPQIQRSINCFKQALKINPFFADAKIKIGMILCHGKNLNDGLKELEEAQKLDPENKILETIIEHLKSLDPISANFTEEHSDFVSRFFDERTTISEIIRGFIKGKEIDPNISDMLSIIRSFPDGNSSFHEIIPILEESVEQHPEYPDLHYSLGTVYCKTQRFEDAEASFKEAIHLNSEYLDAHISLYNAFEKQGKREATLKEGDYLFEKDVPYPDFYCNFGEFCISLKMFDKARDVLQKALNKNPDYARATSLMAEISRKKNGNKDSRDGLT